MVAMVFQSVVITLTPIALSVYLSLYTDVQGMQGELWCVMILSLTEKKKPAISNPVKGKMNGTTFSSM